MTNAQPNRQADASERTHQRRRLRGPRRLLQVAGYEPTRIGTSVPFPAERKWKRLKSEESSYEYQDEAYE